MGNNGIECVSASWNPLAMRCTPVSVGCEKCWHLKMANRLAGNKQFSPEIRAAYAGEGPPVLIPERLERLPRKASCVAIQFMGDLFSEKINIRGNEMREIWRTMLTENQNTYLLLTKRPDRMAKAIEHLYDTDAFIDDPAALAHIIPGVSVENQKAADERIPILLRVKAARRWVSFEPLLEAVNARGYLSGRLAQCTSEHSYNLARVEFRRAGHGGIDWVVCGSESGPGARPMDMDWARGLKD